MPKEIVILTEHFSPSTGATAQLISDLSLSLYHSGIQLRILTSTPGCEEHPFPVHRFSVVSSPGTTSVFSKMRVGISFFLGSLIWLIRNLRPHQRLFIVSNPPFIGLLGILLLLLKRTRYIFLLQDIFPRSAVLTGILPARGPLFSFWSSLTRSVINNSSATITLSHGMVRRIAREFTPKAPIYPIYNWSVVPIQNIPKNNNPIAISRNVDTSFTVQYSGNFGRLHDVITILEAARLLSDCPVTFHFVGGGAKKNQIIQYKKYYSLNNILLFPYQPRNELSLSLAACDLSIVSLVPGADEVAAPSKIYGILASSRPIIAITSNSSEITELISQNSLGYIVSNGDSCQLALLIKSLIADPDRLLELNINCMNTYKSLYGLDRSTDKYASIFKTHNFL